MIESVFILLGIAVGIPMGYLTPVWLEARAQRRRSKIAVLSGNRVITRIH